MANQLREALEKAAQSVANTSRRGLAALTPNGLRGQVTYDLQGKGRSQVPSSGIGGKIARAADSVVPGARTAVVSGQEPKGRAPVGARNRHPRGYAADVDFYDPVTGKQITDPVALQDIAMAMAAKHKANVGYSALGYMGLGRMHLDTMPLDQYPGAAQWGNTALGWRNNLDFARQTGIGPTPYSNAPTPTSRASAVAQKADAEKMAAEYAKAGNRNPASFSAPVGKVSRSPIGPSAPNAGTMGREYSRAADTMGAAGVRGIGHTPGRSQTIGNMLSGMDNPAYGAGQVAPASRQPSKQTVTRAYKEYAVTRALAPKTSPVTTASVAPNVSGLTISRNPFDVMQTPVAPVTAPVPTPKPAPVVKKAPVVKQVVRTRQVARPAPIARPSVPVLSPMQFKNALGMNATGLMDRSVFGYGGQAIDAIKGGAGAKGSTAFSRSNPSVSYTALGNGTVAKHNTQFGTTEYSYAGPTTSLFGGTAPGGTALGGSARGGSSGASRGGNSTGGGGMRSGGSGYGGAGGSTNDADRPDRWD